MSLKNIKNKEVKELENGNIFIIQFSKKVLGRNNGGKMRFSSSWLFVYLGSF